jgi:hypothetical protein
MRSSWYGNSRLASQQILHFLWNSTVHYRVHKSPHYGTYFEQDESHTISVNSILTLSSNLCQVFQAVSTLQDFKPRILYAI